MDFNYELRHNSLLVLTKERRSDFFAALCQAGIFFLVYFAIRYAYPYFFPYYAQGALVIAATEPNRTALGTVCLILLWFLLLKQQKLYKRTNNISFAVMMLTNYIYFVPGSFMNIFCSCDYEYVVIYTLFCIMLNALTIAICKKDITHKTKLVFKVASSKVKNDYICYALAGILLIASLYLNGFRIDITSIFNASEVYQTRLENQIANSGYMYYIWYFIIFGSCIIPTWTVIALEKKQYWAVAFYTLCVFSMYSVSCNRQFLFLYAFSFAFYFFRKRENAIPILMLLMWLVPFVEYTFFDGYIFSDVIRRLSLVPNIDAEFHVDFFRENAPDFLRQTLNFYLSRVGIHSEYSRPIAAIIGEKYFGTTLNANTGLVGGTFANYGYLSIVLGPILYTCALRLFDKIFFNVRHTDVLFITAFVIAFNFTNSETWLEQIIIPSWILLYYLSMLIIPLEGIEKSDTNTEGCVKK